MEFVKTNVLGAENLIRPVLMPGEARSHAQHRQAAARQSLRRHQALFRQVVHCCEQHQGPPGSVLLGVPRNVMIAGRDSLLPE